MQMNYEYLPYLIKFGSRENCKKLLEQGNIHLQPLSFFKKQSSQISDMYDQNEGLMNQIIDSGYSAKIQIDIEGNGDFKNLNTNGFKLKTFQDSKNICIYSLMAIPIEITNSSEPFLFHKNLIKDRDTFVIIREPKIFTQRIDTALSEMGLNFDKGLVDYYDDKVSQQNLNLVNKSCTFEYQLEYRYVVRNSEDQAISFNVGSLYDIAEIHSTSSKNGLIFCATK